MERAIEKGATYLDKLCHKLYDEPKGRGEKTDYVCRLCGGPLETYYCEERLYLVKCADCGTLALVKTVNPEVSASVTLGRPTLTTPNEWVSVEERLPEVGQEVLVYWRNTSQKAEHFALTHYDGDHWFLLDNTERPWIVVVAWMPLPAPPDRRPPERQEAANA